MQRVTLKNFHHTHDLINVNDAATCNTKSSWLYVVYKGSVFSREISRSDFQSKFIRLKFLPELLRGETIAQNIACHSSYELDKLKCFLTITVDITVEKRNRKIFEHFSFDLARDASISQDLDDYEKLGNLRSEKEQLTEQVDCRKTVVRSGLTEMVKYYKQQDVQRVEIEDETRKILVENTRLRCRKRKFDSIERSISNWAQLVGLRPKESGAE